MKNLSKMLFSLAAILVLLSNSGSVYAAIAGRVQFVHGTVQLTTATGVTHAIKKGEAVNEGDALVSALGASAQIRMEDGGMVAMRPDTKLKIDRFTFDGQQDGTERSFFSVFKGGFRAITGTIGKKNKVNYRITTPATTIGIRGTDHEIFVVTPDSLLTATTPIGTYNKVNLGETSMTTEKGVISVLPNQMGFVGAPDQMPQLQPINLNIFTVTAQPAPQGSGDKHEGSLEGKPEGGRETRETATMDKDGMRETATMDKDGMRDTATVDKIEVHGTTTMDKIEVHGTATTGKGGGEGATTLTPSTQDAVKNTIPITTDDMLEQHH
jgi:FecR protein